MPSIEIDRAPEGGGPTVVFRPCDGVEIVVSMPYTTVVWEDAPAGMRGLHQGSVDGPVFVVMRDGTFEFDDKKAVEINTVIPQQMARDLYDALGPLVGGRVTRDIAANAAGAEEEDPQAAGRSRGLRVKKQARRTQRKRRNPKRK
jgi:hypothetical protein